MIRVRFFCGGQLCGFRRRDILVTRSGSGEMFGYVERLEQGVGRIYLTTWTWFYQNSLRGVNYSPEWRTFAAHIDSVDYARGVYSLISVAARGIPDAAAARDWIHTQLADQWLASQHPDANVRFLLLEAIASGARLDLLRSARSL